MKVRILTEPEIRALIGPSEALEQVRHGFSALGRGDVVLPEVMFLDLAQNQGQVHGKGAYIKGEPHFSIKVASGLYRNPERGLPVSFGVVWVFDATTGFLDTVLFDNGYLTELRTGAAGALATDLLAREDVHRIAVIGCGGQARYQLDAHLRVRRPERVLVHCRTPEHASRYATEMSAAHGVPVDIAGSAAEAVRGSDVIVTCTPSRQPVVADKWISDGTSLQIDERVGQQFFAPLFARARESAVTALGAARFAAAFDAGRHSSRSRAIRLALDQPAPSAAGASPGAEMGMLAGERLKWRCWSPRA